MGDSGPAHEVGTFSSRADDLRLGEILSVVYSRDSPAMVGESSITGPDMIRDTSEKVSLIQ